MMDRLDAENQTSAGDLNPSPTAKWFRPWCYATITLVIAFAWPLFDWLQFGLGSSIFSYVLLVPAVTSYLVWIKNRPNVTTPSARCHFLTVAAASLCVIGIAVYFLSAGWSWKAQDRVAILIASFVLGFWAVSGWKLPTEVLRHYAVPIGCLALMVPLPNAMYRGLETSLQYSSAEAAYGMLLAFGTPVLRDGLVFHIPGISLEVAPQCSGIRSTLALFVTSIVAGYLFLHSPWKRIILTVFVIPLAIVRNGFRVFTIAQLCAHYGPQMVHTPIHHQGGPLFFVLSLIPFAALLWYLRRSERRFATGQRKFSN